MTNKEKFMKLVTKEETNTVERAKKRIAKNKNAMSKTKNKELITKIGSLLMEQESMVWRADAYLKELKAACFTKTEIERYGTKENLIDELEEILR